MPILKPETDFLPADLFARPAEVYDWTVAYVRSRQEKALARYLRMREVPFYLPLRASTRRRGGRARTSYLPLFPGYVFLPEARVSRRRALESNLVVSTIAVVDQEILHHELLDLWRLQTSGAPLIPAPYLERGDPVEIAEGPFAGVRGHVLRAPRGLRVVVSISLLRRSVAATVDLDVVVPIPGGDRLRGDPCRTRPRSPETPPSSSPATAAWSARRSSACSRAKALRTS